MSDTKEISPSSFGRSKQYNIITPNTLMRTLRCSVTSAVPSVLQTW